MRQSARNESIETLTLEALHRDLDRKLRALTRRPYLSEREQTEAASLKKQKLRTKDELASRGAR